MPQIVDIDNAVPTFVLKEVVIGSRFRFAIQFRRRISVDPDVYEYFDFTGMTLQALVKDRVARDTNAEADAEFVITVRAGDEGWIDFLLDGDETEGLLERDYESSLKVWPTASPELGDTLASLILPMVYKATR